MRLIGLLCYWNGSGKVRVRGVSTLEIEALDDDTPLSLVFELKEFLYSFYRRFDNLDPASIEAIDDESTKSFIRNIKESGEGGELPMIISSFPHSIEDVLPPIAFNKNSPNPLFSPSFRCGQPC
jgi:hypothetical protein